MLTASPGGAVLPSSSSQQSAAAFPVMDLQRQEATYPVDQANQPPDTQLAAGATALAEADNSILSVWSKGGALLATADLNALFSVPAGYRFSDPRILFDASSARWFMSGMSFDTLNESNSYVSVSATADPAGTWNAYTMDSRTTLQDQPMIGVSADKVVVSWNNFTGSPPATPTFTGSETWVLEKSEMLAGTRPTMAAFAPDSTKFRIVPSVQATSTATEWLVYNDAHCPGGCPAGTSAIGVIALTGSPEAGTLGSTETDLPIVETTDPPAPRQPSGLPLTTEIDDRFLSSQWQNGVLWVAGNDSCIPGFDSTARSCVRLDEVATSGTTSLIHDFDVGAPGLDLSFPAVAADSAGNLFAGFTESSPSLLPSAFGIVAPNTNPTAVAQYVEIAAGQNSYQLGAKNRWGDYSAAAQDPTDPFLVWVTAEYQANAVDVGDWGTATAGLRRVYRAGAVQSSPIPVPSRSPISQSTPVSPSPRT